MKIVNAQSRRVNSRRVGGAVHLECLVWRDINRRGPAQRNTDKRVGFVGLSSSWTERSVFCADDVFSNGR